MPTPIRVPRVGQSAETARLVSWEVAPGAVVRAGDLVAVVETDKTEVEVHAPVDGVLGPQLAPVGADCAVGEVLAEIAEAGEVPAPRRPVSPRARTLAASLGVDPHTVPGTGPDGLVTEADVRAGAARGGESDVWQGRRVRGRVPLSPLRAAAARRLAQTWATVPQFVQMVDVDMSVATTRRTELGVTYNDLVVAAVAHALAADPDRNVAYEAGSLVQLADVDIGVAVDTSAGLVVPVVRGADRLALADLSARVRELAGRARAGTVSPEDTAGGSATVSNLGGAGIRAGTPVLHAPQSILVFAGAVEDRAVVAGGAIGARPTMTLSIAYDHRAFDGAQAAAVTNAVRAWLEAVPARP